MEPEVPLLRILKRRIALHDGVSINVAIDRQNPKNVIIVSVNYPLQ